MPEIGEGGIKGLWKRITGQAAREAVAKQAQLIEQERLRRERLWQVQEEAKRREEKPKRRAAEAFEAIPDSLASGTLSGIPRVRSDEIVILNLDRFDPDVFNGYINPDFSKQEKFIQSVVENSNGEIERLKYSTPYGIVDPNTIP